MGFARKLERSKAAGQRRSEKRFHKRAFVREHYYSRIFVRLVEIHGEDWRTKAYAAATYSCPSCGEDREIWMGLGVGGPQGDFDGVHPPLAPIPIPSAIRCLACDQQAVYVTKAEFSEVQEIPHEVVRFFMPGEPELRRYAMLGELAVDYFDHERPQESGPVVVIST